MKGFLEGGLLKSSSQEKKNLALKEIVCKNIKRKKGEEKEERTMILGGKK